MRAIIRSAIVGLIHDAYSTAYPNVPIFYDNGPQDMNALPELFVEVEIKFYDGQQINIAHAPRTRYKGFVYVSVHTRSGLGTGKVNELLDWFANLLKYQSPGPVRLQAPQPEGSDDSKPGWYCDETKLYWYADEA